MALIVLTEFTIYHYINKSRQADQSELFISHMPGNFYSEDTIQHFWGKMIFLASVQQIHVPL